jgi:hypothetical protein
MEKAEGRRQKTGALAVLFSAFCLLPSDFAHAQATELSSLTIPIHTTLAPLLPQIESQVPKSMAKLDGYELDPAKEFGLKYRVVRDPIALNMQGRGLHVTTTVRYQLEGCRRTQKPFGGPVVMWPCVSCGFNEPLREAWIAIDTRLDWDAGWRLRSTTKARPVEFPNKCTVTFVHVDITNWKIAPLVNEQLRDVARSIDANTPKVTNLRPNVEQIWAALQRPAEVAPKTWLVLEPLDLTVAPLTGSGLRIESALTLRARTRLVVGARPVAGTMPLPPLRVETPAAGGIRVPFDVEVPYAEAGRIITEQFGARKYDVGGAPLALDALTLAPAREGRVSIAATIDYRGGGLRKYRGLVYLEGTPHFDAATKRMTITNVDYSLDPRRHNPFVRLADRVMHDAVRTAIADSASLSVAPQLAVIRGQIEQAITRPLAKGIRLTGHVDAVDPTELLLGSDRITVRAVAVGSAEITAAKW